MAAYVLGIDQSTQGTKALLFDQRGALLGRCDLPHRQMIDEKGWVEHDPKEIYDNTIQVVRRLTEQFQVTANEILAIGISNQRETALVWDRNTGEPVGNAIVWQCARGAGICENLKEQGYAQLIEQRTGLQLSPYFSAAKIAWVLAHTPEAKERAAAGELCCGTMDSWLIYRLTGGKEFVTDYSNASRTQLFHIQNLCWDEEICNLFQIPIGCLAQVKDSNAMFGTTNFEGLFSQPIPIRAVMGDSHGALFGQGCLHRGMVKATYGTGSSIMMNIGHKPVFSRQVVTSLAWSMDGVVQYVLEGNINYTGAVITWLKEDLQLIRDPSETEDLAKSANPGDTTYLVPAFSGLGAPYWNSDAKAALWGMTRTTKRAEIVKAALESIAYQITDVVKAMSQESGIDITQLRADGGPTRNQYLMQFQSDMTGIPIQVPEAEELSGIGVAYAAGIAVGLYEPEALFEGIRRTAFTPKMEEKQRNSCYDGWKKAVSQVLQS